MPIEAVALVKASKTGRGKTAQAKLTVGRAGSTAGWWITIAQHATQTPHRGRYRMLHLPLIPCIEKLAVLLGPDKRPDWAQAFQAIYDNTVAESCKGKGWRNLVKTPSNVHWLQGSVELVKNFVGQVTVRYTTVRPDCEAYDVHCWFRCDLLELFEACAGQVPLIASPAWFDTKLYMASGKKEKKQ
jgi:hypothetical protein